MKQKLEVISKSYEVRVATIERWHDEDGWEQFMANSAREAKRMYAQAFDVSFDDLECRRDKDSDLVMHEGETVNRYYADMVIAQDKRKSARTAKVMAFPADTLFYVQKGYVGNCVLFWAQGGAGYTTRHDRAHVFTRDEIINGFCGHDYEVKIWPKPEVDAKLRLMLDSQDLDQKQLC